MRQPTDRVKTFCLRAPHLNGAAIMACSIADHMQTVTDCERCAESLHREVAELRRLLFELSGLFQRYDAGWQLGAAAREHPTFKVPEWFFEQESDNLKAMLTRRVRYLRSAKLDVDATWDLLVEFLEANHHPVDQVMLSEIVTAVYRKWGR